MLAACGGSDSGGSKDAGEAKSSLVLKAQDTTKQAKRGGVMKTYWDADISDYDVHNTRNAGQNIPNFTYSRFVQIKPGFLQPTEWEVVGDMAESWEWSPDGLTLSMKLRQGAGWAPLAPVNGRAVTIEDIAYTWKRWIERGSNRGDYLNSLDPDSPVLSMNTTDARTFVFKLAFPMVGLLGMMASNIKQSYILPTEADGKYEIRSTPIGSGPVLHQQLQRLRRLDAEAQPELLRQRAPVYRGDPAPDHPRVRQRAGAVPHRQHPRHDQRRAQDPRRGHPADQERHPGAEHVPAGPGRLGAVHPLWLEPDAEGGVPR